MNFHPKHPFNLPLLPPSFSVEESSQSEIIKLLIEANKAISELNGLCHAIPNAYHLLTHILPILESRDSSAIEGVHTTVKTLLETQIKAEKEQDPINKEGLRYKEALDAGSRSLKKYSLSTRTILNIHRHLLLIGGEFKKQGNQIAKGTETIYTPPDPTQINKLMHNWEHYVHSSDDMTGSLIMTDPLIKIIISHYQFEAIHPFSDGNGRTGRILMILQMQLYKLLDLPVLYISSQLFKRRKEYYSRLLNVSKSEEWISLIKFFLTAFEKQAKDTKQIILNIIDERKKMKDALYKNNLMGKDLLDHIFTYPVTHATFMGEKLKLTYQTAGKHLAALEKVGLLKSQKSGTYKFYYNTGLLDCLKA